jgi:cellulose synthase/poly-beta-1,6-N-acetylglucosamine synthase-like glycosyltransferase
MTSKLRKAISYFPIRYYAAATLFAWIFMQGSDYIRILEAYPIASMLNFFHIPALVQDGDVYFAQFVHHGKMTIPTFIQTLFLAFFPAVAVAARTNLTRRLRILLFGGLCLLAFITFEFLLIITFYQIEIIHFNLWLHQISAAGTIVVGSLIIHFTLFTNITLPARTRIKPVLKKRRGQEYFYLATVMAITVAIFYAISQFLFTTIGLERNWSALEFVHIYLWLSLASVIRTSYWIANLVHETLAKWINRTKLHNELGPVQDDVESLSISILIPAYNEEKLVGRCIEGIDKAAAKYSGKVEIVLVNDGSTDNTENVVTVGMANLKHAHGKFYTIPNSGKGFALEYGLEKTTGDIIFRTDADSVIDENALTPMVNHFKDPAVGCVTGWVVPLGRGKNIWLNAQYLQYANALYIRRAQETFDALLIPPGCSTAFRRSTLKITGGWVDNIFGEDSEIGNRVARYGYKVAFEPKSIVYSQVPDTLMGVMHQRARWGVAFYQSRGRNWRLARELWTPRSLFFQWELLSQGSRFAKNMIYPTFAALIIMGWMMIIPGLVQPDIANFPQMSDVLWILTLKIVSVNLLLTIVPLILLTYALHKVRKVSAIVYYPFLRIVDLIITLIVRPTVAEALLHWSVRWKTHTTESFKALRKVVKRVDPLYPDGLESSVPAPTLNEETLKPKQEKQMKSPV